MSFILDALRKSEHERQRQLGPSIAELPVARPAPRVPPWVWVALAALLSLNVALLAWFLTRDTPPAPPATAAAPPPAATMPSAPPAAGGGVTAPSSSPPAAAMAAPAGPPAPAAEPPAVEPAPATPAPAARNVRPLAAEAEAEPPAAGPTFAAPDAPDPSLLPAPPPAPRPAAVTAGVPTIDQLPPQATAGLPPLEVSLHIYAAQPAQRAVFINGTRYREGDSLPGGAQVREITPDGVVLSYGGQRFLLPRQ